MQFLFERDPARRQAEAEVVATGQQEGRPFVVLSDTIFYPEGGGQPADRGTIAASVVLDVQRAGATIRHLLDRPLAPGRVELVLDWERRFDHMQQHTGQHLLSALAEDLFGWKTTAFHLGPAVSDIELAVPSLTDEARAALEDRVAAEIRAARPVRVRCVTREEFAGLEKVRTRGLPDGHAGEIRLVEIEGIDLNTCGGTHLANTAEIEALSLLASEPMRGGTRVHFVAGRRARRRMAAHEQRNARLRGLIGAPEDEFATALEVKWGQVQAAERRVRRLEQELAETAAAALAAEAGARGEPIAAAHHADRDATFLAAVAKALSRRAGSRLALLTAGPGPAGPFVLVAGADFGGDLAALGRIAAEGLSGRGGGSGRIFQGKAERIDRLEATR
ncbi:MAG: alanyl-tRNA editing protein, partial [Acidobacteria bacterium]|nr:alanyl-tRNA editing protein [Acidobacteriota bacterium]